MGMNGIWFVRLKSLTAKYIWPSCRVSLELCSAEGKKQELHTSRIAFEFYKYNFQYHEQLKSNFYSPPSCWGGSRSLSTGIPETSEFLMFGIFCDNKSGFKTMLKYTFHCVLLHYCYYKKNKVSLAKYGSFINCNSCILHVYQQNGLECNSSYDIKQGECSMLWPSQSPWIL